MSATQRNKQIRFVPISHVMNAAISIYTDFSNLSQTHCKPYLASIINNSKMEATNKYVVVKAHIDGAPKESHFELKTCTVPLSIDPASDDILIKNLYVSVDPYHLNRMKSFSPTHKFVSRASLGKAFDANGVGKVLASGNSKYEKDDLVLGTFNWAQYSLVKEGNIIHKVESSEFPLSQYLGVLGFSGLTAYAGFFDVCKPQEGEKVFVSAACGSVGYLVGQHAKNMGCYVVGSVGSPQKVELLKNKLGFDDAFNYKEERDLKFTLKRYFPNGIDIYFDNVGGEMLEAVIANMNAYGRVSACGVISEYTDEIGSKRASPNMLNVVYKRINIRGFMCSDYASTFENFISTTSDLLRSGKLKTLEDVSIGVESIPSAFVALFKGDNIGKKIIKIADDDLI